MSLSPIKPESINIDVSVMGGGVVFYNILYYLILHTSAYYTIVK